MNFFDRLAAALLPDEAKADRDKARSEALALAQDEDWLVIAIQHHRLIETLFAEATKAEPGAARVMALRRLAQVLGAHAMAEETVLYPALIRSGEKYDATMAYEEQTLTKIELAALELIDARSPVWSEKLASMRKAVFHHTYQEESDWFPRLHRSLGDEESLLLTSRFEEEYQRYGDPNPAPPSADIGHDPGFGIES